MSETEAGAESEAPARPTSWVWPVIVAVMAAGSAWSLHGLFRIVSLGASAVAMFAMLRRIRPDRAPAGEPPDGPGGQEGSAAQAPGARSLDPERPRAIR